MLDAEHFCCVSMGPLILAIHVMLSTVHRNHADASVEVAVHGLMCRLRFVLWKNSRQAANLLNVQVSEWPAIRELQGELEPYASLYSITNDFSLRYEEWLFGPVKDLNAEEVETNVGEWFKKVRRAGSLRVSFSYSTLR